MFGIYRVILACLVVAEHFGGFDRLGHLAVASFFVLSGFLMTMLMDGPYRGRIGAFALNRFLRLYPAYWFFGAVTAALLLAGFTSKLPILGFPPNAFDWARQIAFISYWRDTTLVPISWAVTNEIIMYALIALGISRTAPRVLVWLAIGLLYDVWAWLFTNGDPDFTYFLPMAASFPFAVGACVWRFRDRLLPTHPEPRQNIGPVLGVTVVCAVLFGIDAALTGSGFRAWSDWLWIQHIVATAGVTIGLYRIGPLVPVWLKRADLAIGRVSYPMYLNHFTAGMLVMSLGLPRLPATAVIMGVAALGGVISYWLIDRPIEGLRSNIRDTPRPPAAT
jgi:peptidoglycan/LPS O-acetylase OafA/YrhL